MCFSGQCSPQAMWHLFLILIFGRFCNSAPSLDKEYKDVIQLNKYTPATSALVERILKAIQVFDCYDEMVNKKKALWHIGSEFTNVAFDALDGLKATQKEFTNTISKSLIDLKALHVSLRQKPDIVGQIDVKNAECFMGGNVYKKEDCEDCRNSIPGFKSKAQSLDELRQIILDMQITIPKQFLYYANDIFVIVAESIRIIEKIWTCLETEKDTTKCESRDKSIVFFTKKMGEIATKEDDHVKMIVAERSKWQTIVAQLVLEVEGTMDGMAHCLNFKNGVSLFYLLSKGVLPLPKAARNVGVDLNKIKITDTKRVVKRLQNEVGESVGSKIARGPNKKN